MVKRSRSHAHGNHIRECSSEFVFRATPKVQVVDFRRLRPQLAGEVKRLQTFRRFGHLRGLLKLVKRNPS